MTYLRNITVAVAIAASALCARAQDDGGDKYRRAYDTFRRQSQENYDSFRRRCNDDYARFVENAWRTFRCEPPLNRPEREKDVPPQPYDGDTCRAEPRELPHAEVVPQASPEPQPQPVEPIREQPQPEGQPKTAFTFYGTGAQVRLDPTRRLTLTDTSEAGVAEAWRHCSDGSLDNAVRDCLALRLGHSLCDWAYLRMLLAVGEAFCGKDTDEATLLAAYIYCQSGYRMRLARGAEGRLYMLVATRHTIYGRSYFNIDGEYYYPIDCPESSLAVCGAAFPGEQSLSLYLSSAPSLDVDASEPRSLQSARYPEMRVNTSVNKNLLAFYNDYPASEVGGNFMTKWAMYADTPLDKAVADSLYPALRRTIDGMPAIDAAQRLLNFVQTAFAYDYDENVWGEDRAFFAEETLYYPFCDCEDRSILFSRLVRDLLGLRVVLVYYPGHLATAVAFAGDAPGDYLLIDGTRYTVCDPTFIGAGVGRTMSGMDNAGAKAILLK